MYDKGMGNFLGNARMQKGDSVEDVRVRSGYSSRITISGIEAGKYGISAKNIKRIVAAYRLTPAELQ
ncbi:MAG: hypothetical protein A3D44_02695 [Candidatus Staskawiczbacteria bacterium RIFCSPHIGHO2_02_FULL_42_22]|uniref:HTH cro/C1-type domain-containing protein n=1 Tax=Candidatus Staskawiczbacteria bacterium RIFCSPHIGHO2_02_FULL_42_22 TaxID=1802207 RepID=A0A1G2I3K2_9BACT|nr:MAG: hypothetical protein A3D44_02695 [Candidatus Staskawiczbacteria bacterium RIFCSPHIGHO2_02_FULL_42_22]